MCVLQHIVLILVVRSTFPVAVHKRGRKDYLQGTVDSALSCSNGYFAEIVLSENVRKQHLLRVPDNQSMLLRSCLLLPDGDPSERPHHVRRDQPVVSLCDVRPVVGRPTDRRLAARRMTAG
jgi:hypothetical protein